MPLSRPAAFLYLAFVQLGNTHLITDIYVQTGLLKYKWIKSWSGKKIKPYCTTVLPAYLGCDIMQATGILPCKRHWEFNAAAQPAPLPAMHLADGRDPQPHPSTFDLMFQSFLPSLNSHLTTAEAQCISTDGSKLLSELTGGTSCTYSSPGSKRAHPLIHTLTPPSSKTHIWIFCLNMAFPLQQMVNAINQLAGSWLLSLNINTFLFALPTGEHSQASAAQPPASQERNLPQAVKRPRLCKPLLPLGLKVQ